MKLSQKTGLLIEFGLFASSLLLLVLTACQSPDFTAKTTPPVTTHGEAPKPSPTQDRLDPAPYLGLRKSAAIALAHQKGLKQRIVQEDGKSFPITKDLRPDRLNFVVEKGMVTSVRFY